MLDADPTVVLCFTDADMIDDQGKSLCTYDPELPAYDLLNLRGGLRRNNWDVALFLNNVFDERALLSLDRERGTLARIGFLTNQPRTFGISTRVDF